MLALSIAALSVSVATMAGMAVQIGRRFIVDRAVPQGRHAAW